jgi:hypothetical protein
MKQGLVGRDVILFGGLRVDPGRAGAAQHFLVESLSQAMPPHVATDCVRGDLEPAVLWGVALRATGYAAPA